MAKIIPFECKEAEKDNRYIVCKHIADCEATDAMVSNEVRMILCPECFDKGPDKLRAEHEDDLMPLCLNCTLKMLAEWLDAIPST